MINLPLECKTLQRKSTDITPNITTINLGIENTYQLNATNTKIIKIVYPALSDVDCVTVETAIKATMGCERILYNSKRYILKDGYTVKYTTNSNRIEFSLEEMGL